MRLNRGCAIEKQCEYSAIAWIFSPVQANYCYWLYGLAGRSDDRPQILLDQFNLYVRVCACMCIWVCVLPRLADVRKTKEKKKNATTTTKTKTISAKKEPRRRKRLWKRLKNQDGEWANITKSDVVFIFWSSARSFTPVRHLIYMPGTPVAMCSPLYFVHSLINGSAPSNFFFVFFLRHLVYMYGW